MNCPKCGAAEWVRDLVVLAAEGSLAVAVQPSTWREKAKGFSRLRAGTCGRCGYTEFYAEAPTAVWKAAIDDAEAP